MGIFIVVILIFLSLRIRSIDAITVSSEPGQTQLNPTVCLQTDPPLESVAMGSNDFEFRKLLQQYAKNSNECDAPIPETPEEIEILRSFVESQRLLFQFDIDKALVREKQATAKKEEATAKKEEATAKKEEATAAKEKIIGPILLVFGIAFVFVGLNFGRGSTIVFEEFKTFLNG